MYAVHELGLTPESISAEEKKSIQKELAQVIKVNARPLTVAEWQTLFSENGFEVIQTETNQMNAVMIVARKI